MSSTSDRRYSAPDNTRQVGRAYKLHSRRLGLGEATMGTSGMRDRWGRFC